MQFRWITKFMPTIVNERYWRRKVAALITYCHPVTVVDHFGLRFLCPWRNFNDWLKFWSFVFDSRSSTLFFDQPASNFARSSLSLRQKSLGTPDFQERTSWRCWFFFRLELCPSLTIHWLTLFFSSLGTAIYELFKWRRRSYRNCSRPGTFCKKKYRLEPFSGFFSKKEKRSKQQ